MIDRVKTAQENVRWAMWIYPWQNSYPDHDKDKTFDEVDPVIVERGILSLQLFRSKDNPYGTCHVNFFGPLPTSLFIGNWVLIKSFNGVSSDSVWAAQNDQSEGVVRFFGQIFNLKTSYQISSSGGFSQYTSITIREWSFLYSIPVRYDSYAYLNSIQNPLLKFMNQAKTISESDKKAIPIDEIGKIILDPFQMCALSLKWIGGLSAMGLSAIKNNDKVYQQAFSGVNLDDIQLPDVALLLPQIPKRLLKDLGVPQDEWKNPFSGNFVHQIFGVLENDCGNDFNERGGYFSSDSQQSFYKPAMKRPFYSNIIPVFVQGQSVWELLQSGCDTQINEVYTDLYYYLNEQEKIAVKPMLVMRDKPFLLQAEKNAEEGNLHTNWSVYDNIPRILIPLETVERIDLDHSFTNSPNYIRVQYVGEGGFPSDALKVMADLQGTVRLPAEMLRYGGQVSYIQTPYVSTNEVLDQWYKDVATLQTYWEGLRYRMPNAQVILRDTNVCLSVGSNLRLPIGKFTFVGHIQSLSITYSRNSEGTHRTTTVVNLERMVMENPQNIKQLTFIPDSLIRDIFDYTAIVTPVGDTGAELFANIDPNSRRSTEIKRNDRKGGEQSVRHVERTGNPGISGAIN